MSEGYEDVVLHGIALNLAPSLFLIARKLRLFPKLSHDARAALCYHAAIVAITWASPSIWRLKYLIVTMLVTVL